MYNIYFAIAANRVIVDKNTNLVSIVDLYEKLQSSQFPVIVPKFTLLFYVSRTDSDPEKSTLELSCKLKEHEILKAIVDVDFGGKDVTRVLVALDSLRLPEPGQFIASLSLDGENLGQLEVDVERCAANLDAHVFSSGQFRYQKIH